MDQTLRLPLSGNVTQTINPWSWALPGAQFGLVNISLGRSADPDLEADILDTVGSYGRQIGQIGDALKVLLAHLPLDNLDPDERKALRRFHDQMEQVAARKKERGR